MENKAFLLELPVAIGGIIYNKLFPTHPQVVIGYRIGRMMDEEDYKYEEDYSQDCAYIQYASGVIELSVPITAFGRTIFLTEEEAKSAALVSKIKF